MTPTAGPRSSPSRLRVAYLCLGSPVSAHVNGIIEGLKGLGWTVELYAPFDIDGARGRKGIRYVAGIAAAQLRLWRRGRNLDAIYIRHHVGALPTIVWARLCGIPVVQELNGPYDDPLFGRGLPRPVARVILWMIRFGVRMSSAVVVVSSGLREMVLAHGDSRNVHVIPNGADVGTFRPGAPADVPVPAPYVVWFGFMGSWQGIDTMVAAAEQPDWPDGLRLVMIGEGPEASRVDEAAGRNPRILHLGRMPQSSLAGIVAGSVAGLSPQNRGGGRSLTGLSAVKVFETLACGAPVIVTDFPGHAELVGEGGCGMVVPEDDPKALARAVASLFRDEEARRTMGRRGRRMVEAEHSWEHRASQTAAILISLRAGRRRVEGDGRTPVGAGRGDAGL